jgi:hypothetical protein|nr:MAG TPA: hypothetical protein [Caudoviricetes sp.]
MKNIDDIIQAIEERGAKFTINFQERTLKVNDKYVNCKDKTIGLPRVFKTDEFLKLLDSTYRDYKYSLPSERSESRSKNYFKALPEEELTDLQMWCGMNREKARFIIEMLCLSQILNGWQWDEEKMGKWFYQSKKDKDLVLLRQWFDNN